MDSFNRQACFNELSFLDKDDNEDLFLIFSNYAKTIKALKTKGFNGVRYEQGITSLVKENLEVYLIFEVIQMVEPCMLLF